jgi:DNA-binding NarL/FixJ family response regulator
MFREASLRGRDPQPGAAQLLLARGRPEAAAAAILSAVGGAGRTQGSSAPGLLGPCVEILLAVGQIDHAREAATELAESAEQSSAPLLAAWAAQARGLVSAADGDFAEARASFREAWTLWQQLECPYEAARVRVWLANASAGDEESARHHRAAARAVFERLGALPDIVALQEAARTLGSGDNSGLSNREREILALAAEGATNRQIASQLHISQHTVARHLSNIFDKLGVSTRTAAAAFAHTHNLVGPVNNRN